VPSSRRLKHLPFSALAVSVGNFAYAFENGVAHHINSWLLQGHETTKQTKIVLHMSFSGNELRGRAFKLFFLV